MSDAFSDEQLLGYLDELLPPGEMARVEATLRFSESLRRRAAALTKKRDQGGVSVAEIWRRGRLSCPTRKQLGGYLLGSLDPHWADYVAFHVQTVGCRLCAANLEDLEQSLKPTPGVPERRRKFFHSSAGYLRRNESD